MSKQSERRAEWLSLCAEYNALPVDVAPDWGEPYVAVLCSYCRHYEGDGRCEHPLDIVRDLESAYAIEGGDCWGFRPSWKLDEARAELEQERVRRQ